MDSSNKQKNDFAFIGVLITLLMTFLGIAFIVLFLLSSSNILWYKLIFNIILVLTAIGCIYIMISILLFYRLLNGKKLSKTSKKMTRKALLLLYPQVLFLTQTLKLEKDRVRKVFSEINNRLILTDSIKVKSEEILLLLPHCLQKSSCNHKITTDIENCKKCGQCNIDEILNIKNEFNIKCHVATGGTLARKIVKEARPKLIIAVACERDLSSGILDIRGIPVLGVLLDRPEGPCVNTKVDLSKVREAIKLFVKKEGIQCSIHPMMDLDQG